MYFSFKTIFCGFDFVVLYIMFERSPILVHFCFKNTLVSTYCLTIFNQTARFDFFFLDLKQTYIENGCFLNRT